MNNGRPNFRHRSESVQRGSGITPRAGPRPIRRWRRRSAFSTVQGSRRVQIKATIRGSKVKEAAPSAVEALRRYRDMQARPGVTACSVMKSGVLVGQAELVSAATVEDLRARSVI